MKPKLLFFALFCVVVSTSVGCQQNDLTKPDEKNVQGEVEVDLIPSDQITLVRTMSRIWSRDVSIPINFDRDRDGVEEEIIAEGSQSLWKVDYDISATRAPADSVYRDKVRLNTGYELVSRLNVDFEHFGVSGGPISVSTSMYSGLPNGRWSHHRAEVIWSDDYRFVRIKIDGAMIEEIPQDNQPPLRKIYPKHFEFTMPGMPFVR